MDTINGPSRQSVVGLPPINHLEADKIKREEAEYHRKHSAPTMVSPLHPFPGPLHPYSNHQSSVASSLPAPSGGLLSPPESRRTSGDEKEQIGRPHARQSLPSIQEALGPDPPLPYPPPPPSAPVPAPQSFFPPSSTASAVDHRPRNFSVDHINNQGPPNPFSQPRSPFANKPASTAPPPPPTHVQTDPFPRTPYSSNQHNSKLPTLHPLRTTQSPPVPTSRPNPPYLSYPHQPSPANEAAAPHSAGPMNPQYPYPQYHPNHPFSAPAQSGPNARYPPSSATYSAPPLYPPPSWRSDGPEFGHPDEKKSSEKLYYGVSVKRHLESFDLEASLNEMAEGAGRVADFSKIYRQRAHENQRIGMTPQSMPRLDEVDEMLKQSEKIQVSLQRMREVVLSHQQATFAEPPREAHYRPINGSYEHDGRNSFHEDPKGSPAFAGLDPNKRPKRGQRAAPPGRCHSCNRAETPEWRRGPDGARTLCNACGLHYAKLTRKMAGNGKQAMTSSNLRPKTLGDGSPAA